MEFVGSIGEANKISYQKLYLRTVVKQWTRLFIPFNQCISARRCLPFGTCVPDEILEVTVFSSTKLDYGLIIKEPNKDITM